MTANRVMEGSTTTEEDTFELPEDLEDKDDISLESDFELVYELGFELGLGLAIELGLGLAIELGLGLAIELGLGLAIELGLGLAIELGVELGLGSPEDGALDETNAQASISDKVVCPQNSSEE